MWYRRLIMMFAGICAGLFDASIASWFPGAWGAMRLALPLVILIAAFSSLERSLTVAVAAGFMMDALLPSFGFITLRYVLIALLIRGLAQAYVTNRSAIGSVALGVAGVAADRLLLWVIMWIRGFMAPIVIPEARPSIVAEFAWVIIVMMLAFLLIAALTRRFMPLVSRRV